MYLLTTNDRQKCAERDGIYFGSALRYLLIEGRTMVKKGNQPDLHGSGAIRICF